MIFEHLNLILVDSQVFLCNSCDRIFRESPGAVFDWTDVHFAVDDSLNTFEAERVSASENTFDVLVAFVIQLELFLARRCIAEVPGTD